MQNSYPCEICKKSTRPLASRANIAASEWYCEKCHKSYFMDKETATMILQMQAQPR